MGYKLREVRAAIEATIGYILPTFFACPLFQISISRLQDPISISRLQDPMPELDRKAHSNWLTPVAFLGGGPVSF